jgi:hypothetical protein
MLLKILMRNQKIKLNLNIIEMFLNTFIKLFISDFIIRLNKKSYFYQGQDMTKNETEYPKLYEDFEKHKLLRFLENKKITNFNKIDKLNYYNLKYTTLNITNGNLYKDWDFKHF